MKRPDRVAALALAMALLTFAVDTTAQPAAEPPSTEQIIEALRPALPASAASAPRTRSLRNFVVRERGDKPAEARVEDKPLQPPSVSLAVQFDFDSARLRPEGEQALERLATALNSAALAGGRFLIEGHTDARGSAAYNLKLSQARADEVSRFLQARGVRAERLQARGRGAEAPMNAIDPFAAENRRVRVVNLAAAP